MGGACGTVLYDGRCPLCIATVARLRRWDTAGRLEYLDARDTAAVAARFPWLAQDEALREMRLALRDGRVLGGFDAVRALAAMLPRLRPLAFVLYLPGIRPLGVAGYRFVAAHRPQTFHCMAGHCDLPPV
jgi:predicted DCC family thiol-disulfide oxidoreductase YuxK